MALLFKPTSGGWVYRAPNPWVFGSRTHCLVNDAQKAQIEEILKARKLRNYILLGALLFVVWTVQVITGFSTGGRHFGLSTALEVLVMSLLVLVPGIAAVSILATLQLRRLRRVLAGASMTDEKITRRDIRAIVARQQSRHSITTLSVLGALSGLLSASQVLRLIEREPAHPLLSDARSYFLLLSVLVSAWLAVRHFVQALRNYHVAHQQ